MSCCPVESSTLTVPIQVSPVIGTSCLGSPLCVQCSVLASKPTLNPSAPETKILAIVSSDFFLFFRYSDTGDFATARTNGSSTDRVCHLSLVIARASALAAVALCAFTPFTISGSVLSDARCLISTSSFALISGGACPKPATVQLRNIRQAVSASFNLAIIGAPRSSAWSSHVLDPIDQRQVADVSPFLRLHGGLEGICLDGLLSADSL